jgi:hypothetical protein
MPLRRRLAAALRDLRRALSQLGHECLHSVATALEDLVLLNP